MANAKTIINAPTGASKTRSRRKHKIISTGKNKVSDKNLKNPSEALLQLSSQDISNVDNGCIPDSNLDKIEHTNSTKHNATESLVRKCRPLSKSGRIKKKSKNHLTIIDNLLKSELMINDKILENKSINREKTHKQKLKTMNDGLNNNVIKKNGLDVPCILNNNRSNKLLKKPQSSNAEDSLMYKQASFKNGLVFNVQYYKCDYCKKSFVCKTALNRHMYRHIGYRFPCTKCSKKYCVKGNLQAHMEKEHPEQEEQQIYKCNKCDKAFLLKQNLSIHLMKHINDKQSFKCVFCEKKFSQQIMLAKHEKKHLVCGQYICSVCNMSYSTRSQLIFHIKSHLNIKEFVCQYCGKDFLRPNSIRRHVQICHAGHRIQCPICKKQLRGHLTEHMRTHEKKRPHQCPDCGQSFTQSTQLNVHRRSHTGDRPYPCRICGRPFSHSNALMLHLRRHTGEKPFFCAMCPMAFSQLPHMKAHMLKIHGKVDPYKCENCNHFFKLKVDLEEHIKGCSKKDQELSFEEKIQSSVQYEEVEMVESTMSISQMRFYLALLLTKIASKDKLKYLGFNKRLIDDILMESLEAMGLSPCVDASFSPIKRLKINIELLLRGTIPKKQMEKFQNENKTTEQLLELLTEERKKKK